MPNLTRFVALFVHFAIRALLQQSAAPPLLRRQGQGGFGGDGIQAERSYCEVYEEGNVTNQLRH